MDVFEPPERPTVQCVLGIAALAAVAVAVAFTGGEDSPLDFAFLPVLIHAALVCGRTWVLAEGALVALALAAPLLVDPDAAAAAVAGDLAEAVVWVLLALFVTAIRDRLRRNEQRYRSLFDHHPDSVSARDPWGRIQRMNRAASALVGLDQEILASRKWTDFVPEDRLAEIEEHFVEALKGRPCSFESQLRHVQGHRVDVAITFIPIVVDDDVTGVFHITRDITARVRAQSDRALFERVVDRIGDGVLIWDPEADAVLYANRAAEQLFGVGPGALVGSAPSGVTHQWARWRLRDLPADPEGDDEGDRAEFDIRRPDGTPVPVEVVTQRVVAPDGRTVAVAVLRDLTGRRETRRAMRMALEAQRASAESLRSVNEMQKTFLQAVSHELRTPLTSIAGFAHTLEGHWRELPVEKVSHLLGRLLHNADRLAGMLQDLLDVDRLSRGAVQLTVAETDLGELCRRVVEHVGAPDRPMQVVGDAGVRVEADTAKIERVVENLVYNAVRHTPEGTPVRVRVDALGDGALVTVADQGPGVPKELRETIFEPFRQGPGSADAASPGTGIGLALVARFSSLHGGRAWVEDAPGGGAAFKVFLPSRPPRDVVEELGVQLRTN